MKTLSMQKLAQTIKHKRNTMGLTQDDVSKKVGINRALISRIERENFIPSITQLEQLAEVLEFDITELMERKPSANSFMALRSEDLSVNEREGVEKIITMMLSLRQQILLRSRCNNEQR